jgi:cytochrome c5
MARRLIVTLVLVTVALIIVACGGSTATPPPTNPAPVATAPAAQPTAKPGVAPYPVVPAVKDGQALMNERCTVCHDATRITSLKQTRAGWETTVTKWRSKGAVLTDQEANVLIDYLAATYK